MTALALLFALAPPPPPPLPVWRVIDRPELHVGMRPFVLVTSDGPEVAAGVTVQVSILHFL